jgi:excisionase family DNA binding protein
VSEMDGPSETGHAGFALPDPSAVGTIPVAQLPAVLVQLTALLVAIGARLAMPPAPSPTSPYSAEEAAALLGKTKTWVWRQARAGRLPGRKSGKTWTFPRDDFERLLRRRAHIAA